MDIAFNLEQLKSCELFRDLNDHELNDVLKAMSHVKLEPGEVLVAEGESSDCLYVLLSGRLLVMREGGKIIGQIGRGQTVGEMGIVTNEPRSATVIAMRESLLLKLDQAHFNELWSRHPKVLFEVTKIITQRLQKTLKSRQKYNNASNIVILPANQQTDIHEFMHQLSSAFDHKFRYKILRRSDFPAAFSEAQFYQCIQELERQNDYLFYEISLHEKEWLSISLGYADRILVVADGSQIVNYDPEILPLLAQGGIHPEIKRLLVLLHDESSGRPKNTEAWLRPIPFFRHYHIHLNRQEDFQRLLRFLNGTAVGIVLGGGGTRGWAHTGVMKYIYEHKIPFDACAGTSGGALNAAILSYARDYQDYYDISTQFVNMVSFREYTIPLSSILSSRSITRACREVYGDVKIEDLDKPFICVAADLFSGKEVNLQSGLLWQALRASTSIPGIYPPVYLRETRQLLVDGGVVNNLPVDVLKNYFEGFGKTIAVDISDVHFKYAHYDYPLELTWPVILWQKLLMRSSKLIIPSIMNTFIQGLEVSAAQKAKANAVLSDVYIKPEVAEFPLLDPSRKKELVEIGYSAAEKLLANWQVTLNLL